MSKIKFIAADGIEYEMESCLASMQDDEIPLDQFEYLKRFQKFTNSKLETFEQVLALCESYASFFLNDFRKAYPDHEVSKLYSHYRDLNEKDIIGLFKFIGNLKTLSSLITQTFDSINNKLELNDSDQPKKRGRPKVDVPKPASESNISPDPE